MLCVWDLGVGFKTVNTATTAVRWSLLPVIVAVLVAVVGGK